MKRTLLILLLTPLLLAQSYNVPFNPPASGCASPAPAAITFWFNGDGGAVESPTQYTQDGSTEYTADSTKTGTFGTTSTVKTIASAVFGGTNVLWVDTNTGTDTLKYLGFTETSSNIIGTEYGRIGCYVELDVDGGGTENPRLFSYTPTAGEYIRVINTNMDIIRVLLDTGAATSTTSSASGVLDTAGEVVFWEYSWDTSAPSFKVFVNGSQSGSTDTTDVSGGFTSNSGEDVKLGNDGGTLGVNEYLYSNCIIATGTAGRDLDLYAIAVTAGITDYDACNFP